MNLQGATTIFPIEFITLTQDEIDEPEEVFLLILENRDGPLTRPVIQNNIQVNETIICSVGIIQESDSDGKLRFYNCSLIFDIIEWYADILTCAHTCTHT